MANLQDNVPFLGELPLLNHTYYSVELLAAHHVPERSGMMIFPLEEDVFWTEDPKDASRWDWAYGRQEEFHLIRTPKAEATQLRLQTN